MFSQYVSICPHSKLHLNAARFLENKAISSPYVFCYDSLTDYGRPRRGQVTICKVVFVWKHSFSNYAGVIICELLHIHYSKCTCNLQTKNFSEILRNFCEQVTFLLFQLFWVQMSVSKLDYVLL